MENLLDLMFIDNPTGLPTLRTELKLLETTKEIYKRDPGKGVNKVKEIAEKELAFIFFSVKKDFFESYPPEERQRIIKERVGLPAKWEPDDLIFKAIEDFKQDVKTTEDKLLVLARESLEDLITIFQEVRTFAKSTITLLQKDDKNVIAGFDEKEVVVNKAKDFVKAQVAGVGDLKKVLNLVDELELARKATKQKEGKKGASIYETSKELYKDERD